MLEWGSAVDGRRNSSLKVDRKDRIAMLRVILEVLFFLDCFALLGLILLQMSEHSGLGGAFGSGGSTTVFGRDEVRDPRRTLTVGLATVFMVLGFVLSVV
jgi:preprotein translocase subunit SecG